MMKMTFINLSSILLILLSNASFADQVSPGARICKEPIYISTQLQTFGQATDLSGRPTLAHFTVKRAASYYAEYDDVYIADSSSFYYAPTFIVPGFYKTCARNNSGKAINISLGQSGY